MRILLTTPAGKESVYQCALLIYFTNCENESR